MVYSATVSERTCHEDLRTETKICNYWYVEPIIRSHGALDFEFVLFLVRILIVENLKFNVP